MDSVRVALLKDNLEEASFLRLGLPLDFSILRQGPSSPQSICDGFLSIWDSEMHNFLMSLVSSPKKRKAKITKSVAFPFPRIPFSYDQTEKKFTNSILVPVTGISTSYLSQIVPCNLLPKHADYFPVVVLCEILSKAEGPLYVGIRGKGYTLFL